MSRLINISAIVEVTCENEQSMVFEATEILADHFTRKNGNPNVRSVTVSTMEGRALYDTSRKSFGKEPWCVDEGVIENG